MRRGFPVDIYKGDRIGLVLAFWAIALVLGRVQVSQTDYTEDGTTFGSVLNHVTVGRKTAGMVIATIILSSSLTVCKQFAKFTSSSLQCLCSHNVEGAQIQSQKESFC